MNLRLDHLKAFVAVAELGTFTGAAERLQLTQPAVSQQVRQLETRLGARLLERVGRRAVPTAAGAELLAHAERIGAAVEAALDAVARHASGEAGRVRLGTGATACIYLLPDLLRDLRRRMPTLEITVTTGNTGEIVKAVEDNLLDVGFVTLPAGGRMLEVTPLVDDEFVAIAPPGAELDATVTAAELARLGLILYEPGGNTRRIVDEWLARGGESFRPSMALGSVEAIKELVGAGLGCSVLPRLAVADARKRGRLEVRSLSPRLARRLALVVRRDKPRHRGLREMIAALEELSSREAERV